MYRHSLLVLVSAVLLAAACKGDRAPAPTATPPAATAAVTRPTLQPEMTPSLAPPASATGARATPTPAVDPQLPTAVPTPTATPRPDGLEYHFGPGVSDFDRSLIMRATEVTSELLSHGADVWPRTAVFAASSPQLLERAFREDAVGQSWRSEGMADRMTRAVAEANYRGIVINTGHADWHGLDATQRLRAVAHEFVHVIQLEQTGSQVADATLSGRIEAVPPAGPFWLLEGSAEVVSWLVLQELGLGVYAEALFDYAAEATDDSTTLGELESFLGYRDGGREGLALSVLASDYLLRSRSLEALFDFWREVGRGADWTTAFTRQFGVPPAFFYVAFEVYYQDVWAGFRP